jgi:glycosyltransferase involved in cell wall biosynthesis
MRALTQDHCDPVVRHFRVLATSAGFEPGFRGGGPIRSVTAIVDTVSDTTDLWLVTADRERGASEQYPGLSGRWISRGRPQVFYLDWRRPRHWLRLWRDLHRRQFDLLYVNSLWQPSFTILPIVFVKLGIIRARRVLLAPRGELSRGALSLKSPKKRVFLTLWRPFLNSMDMIWHASSEREATDIRTVFPHARVEINEDQVTLPYEPLPAKLANHGNTRVVFIGRIAPMKNLDLVLMSLAQMSKPIDLDIYGPLVDAAYWSKCQVLLRQLPSEVHVRYMGELQPQQVRTAFAGYDAFVFPTRGENFGHVIAESLSASCPVICSDETPWTSVLMAGGGVVVHDLTVGGLRQELATFAAMSPSERLSMRQAAGDAYRSWRKANGAPNILEEVRKAGSARHR